MGLDKGKLTERSIATKHTMKKVTRMNLSKEENEVDFSSCNFIRPVIISDHDIATTSSSICDHNLKRPNTSKTAVRREKYTNIKRLNRKNFISDFYT